MATYNYVVTNIDIRTFFIEGGVIQGEVQMDYRAESPDHSLTNLTGSVVRMFRSDEMDFDEDIDVVDLIEKCHKSIRQSLDKVFTEQTMNDRLLSLQDELSNNLVNKGEPYEPSIRDKNIAETSIPIGFQVEMKLEEE